MPACVVQLAGLGVLLILITLAALMLHVPGADTVGSHARANVFVGVLALGVGTYLVAVRLVLVAPLPRAAFWIVLTVAVAMRATLLPSLPFLSSDIYRYVWDGQVQAAGINPYLHLPVDPLLAPLRDPAVFPLINRADYARTIYRQDVLVLIVVGHRDREGRSRQHRAGEDNHRVWDVPHVMVSVRRRGAVVTLNARYGGAIDAF
ncbi:hypothetical protein MKK67_05975 [Methylobacterium sp. J-072]|uniref:hypothetical protein n=1 Tax=Methylobacterium sp. J-072 TaxID=2836651 RepID=UPI001FB9D96E|nr:hypothetical protein [Methylobacterium sp. J-072]MCJ2092053.1 hypothetical protein [Methylobacterium sp. J-072]